MKKTALLAAVLVVMTFVFGGCNAKKEQPENDGHEMPEETSAQQSLEQAMRQDNVSCVVNLACPSSFAGSGTVGAWKKLFDTTALPSAYDCLTYMSEEEIVSDLLDGKVDFALLSPDAAAGLYRRNGDFSALAGMLEYADEETAAEILPTVSGQMHEVVTAAVLVADRAVAESKPDAYAYVLATAKSTDGFLTGEAFRSAFELYYVGLYASQPGLVPSGSFYD